MWPNSNKSPDFSLFENIQNLAQLLLVPELSSFTFGLSGVELGIIQKKTELSFKGIGLFGGTSVRFGFPKANLL